MVDSLIEKGATLNSTARFGNYDNILDELISSNHHACPAMIALFIKRGAQVNSRVLVPAWQWAKPVGTLWDYEGTHLEAREELLLMLLENVLDVNETWDSFRQDGYEKSALIEAITKGEPELVRLLSNHGANVNLRVENQSYSNALESVFHKILSLPGSRYPGRFYAERNTINLLVEEGASLDNLEGDRLNEALAAAAYAGWDDLVENFLHRGAIPYERLFQERLHSNTALGAAAASDQPRVSLIIHTLLNNDTSLKDKYDYYVATRSVFDWIFREVLRAPPIFEYFETEPGTRDSGRRDSGRLLETAVVLVRNHAVWDRDFTQWVELLRSEEPRVWEQNIQGLSGLEEKLDQNKARFFEKFPHAEFLEEWTVKDAGSLEEWRLNGAESSPE